MQLNGRETEVQPISGCEVHQVQYWTGRTCAVSEWRNPTKVGNPLTHLEVGYRDEAVIEAGTETYRLRTLR